MNGAPTREENHTMADDNQSGPFRRARQSLQDLVQQMRDANIEAEIDKPVDPAEMAAIAKLANEKQLAIVGMLSAFLHYTPHSDEREVLRTIAPFLPELNARHGLHPAAVQHAFTNVAIHLVKELAAARGESVQETWRHVAADLTTEASSG